MDVSGSSIAVAAIATFNAPQPNVGTQGKMSMAWRASRRSDDIRCTFSSS